MRIFIFTLLLLVLIPINTAVFAQTSHTITIPSGSLYSSSSYFWVNELTGDTTGEITISPGDTITWINEDSAFHTVTSVDSLGNIDGIFDSSFIRSGDSYSKEFTDVGDFYYFCDNNHPWMTGVVHVVNSNTRLIENVGSEFNDGLGFNVEYILDVPLENNVLIDDVKNTLTFTISKDTKNSQIVFILPVELIENPSIVWVDGDVVDMTLTSTEINTRIIVPLDANSKEIKIMGSYVIPEFGFLTIGILSIGIFSSLFLIRSKFLML